MKILTGILLILGAVFFSPAQTLQTDTWMGDMAKTIREKPISALVLPGAYRSGLQRVVESTAIPERCNMQSQDTNVYGLMSRGARYLDLSAIYWRGNWYLGNYRYTALFGLQLAVGQTLEEALNDVATFLSEKAHGGEIVLLHITGYEDSKNKKAPASIYGELDSLRMAELQRTVTLKLAAFLYQKSEPLRATVADVLGTVQKSNGQRTGAAIVLFNSIAPTGNYPGITRADSCGRKEATGTQTRFENTDALPVLAKRSDIWQTADMACYTIWQWVLSWRSTDSKCTVQLAETANSGLEKRLAGNELKKLPAVFCTAFVNRSLSLQIIRLNSNAPSPR